MYHEYCLNKEEITKNLQDNKIYEKGNLKIEVKFLESPEVNSFNFSRYIQYVVDNKKELSFSSIIMLSDKCEIVKNDRLLLISLELMEKQIKDYIWDFALDFIGNHKK